MWQTSTTWWAKARNPKGKFSTKCWLILFHLVCTFSTTPVDCTNSGTNTFVYSSLHSENNHWVSLYKTVCDHFWIKPLVSLIDNDLKQHFKPWIFAPHSEKINKKSKSSDTIWFEQKILRLNKQISTYSAKTLRVSSFSLLRMMKLILRAVNKTTTLETSLIWTP